MSTAEPMFPDVGVIAVVPEPWGGMWLSRQQQLTRLARYFNVVWVDPALGWRKLWKGESARPIGQSDESPPPSSGFFVYRQNPLYPAFHGPAFLRRYCAAGRLRQARGILARRGCRKFILYIWQPKFAESLQLVSHDVSCYHIADEYSFSAIETPIGEVERNLIASVDQLFIHSPALLAKKGGINPRTMLVPNGVDYDAFAQAVPVPADLDAIPRPRIGYVGRIKIQLDWELLTRLARSRPEQSFVFVGPMGHMGDRAAVRDELFALPNVHYLGPRAVTEIPAYTQHLDVCLLPYVLNSYTQYIFPLKLNEYLAAGRPVVGSDIRTLRDFENHIHIARSSAEWDVALDRALGPAETNPSASAGRRLVARQYDWNSLTKTIATALCAHLGPPWSQSLRHAEPAATQEEIR